MKIDTSCAPSRVNRALSRRVHSMPFGAEVRPEGTRFRLWAPRCRRMLLRLGDQPDLPMVPFGDGWHEVEVVGASAGTRYCFITGDGTALPDPASRFQPDGLEGLSEVIDPAQYAWLETKWQGQPWANAVLYELHIGAFTPQGTFSAAISKLDHLVRLGVTMIELMPVADWWGDFNWGYDGVSWFAPHARYGRPEEFKAFVEAAHARRLGVMLDIVPNHFGANGNQLPLLAPIFTSHHENVWGDAINFDDVGSERVRQFVCDMALYWLDEFNLDGLRIDSAHMMIDDSRTHILAELAQQVRAARADRHTHLVLENSNNEERWLTRDNRNRPLFYEAQWNDDAHHVLHTCLTGEDTGYFADFRVDEDRTDKLGRALAEGFVYQGEYKRHEETRRGEPSRGLPPAAFILFLQSHDQVGNRVRGDRITKLATPEAVRAGLAITLLSPQIPMLFMGEEWGTDKPFPFFSDVPPDKRKTTIEGRKDELKETPEHEDPAKPDIDEAVDPTRQESFESAKLDWAELDKAEHAEWLAFYQSLIATRRRLMPILSRIAGFSAHYRMHGERGCTVCWRTDTAETLVLHCNLSAVEQPGYAIGPGDLLWKTGSAQDNRLAPWTVIWQLAPKDPAR